MKILAKWIVCVIAFITAYTLFPHSVITTGGMLPLVVAGTILWLVNLLLRPVVQIVSLPVTILTFGLFSIIVNALMVCITDSILPDIRITNFGICLIIALLVSAMNILLVNRQKS